MSPARPAQPEHGPLHLDKAEEFLGGAILALEAGKVDVAVSVAVIAAIRAADAICVARLGKRWTGADHAGAVGLLGTAGSEGAAAAPLLLAILPAKNQAQYSLIEFLISDAEAVLERAEGLVELARAATAAEPVSDAGSGASKPTR